MSHQSQVLETESENPFVIDFTFKPIEPGLKLHRAETQLLLAYLSEILQEIEAEENNCKDSEHVVQSEGV